MATYHPDDLDKDSEFRCVFCDGHFASESQVTSHEFRCKWRNSTSDWVEKRKIVTCKICSEYVWHWEMNSHLIKKHQRQPDLYFVTCKDCFAPERIRSGNSADLLSFQCEKCRPIRVASDSSGPETDTDPEAGAFRKGLNTNFGGFNQGFGTFDF